MLTGIQYALVGLQASDLQMDVHGTRLTSEFAVSFLRVLDSAATSGTLPLRLTLRQDEGKSVQPAQATDERTTFYQLPCLLTADTASALGGSDLAMDMGLYLVAKAAFEMNARVVSTANHEFKELARLGR
jgi:hypothetical protein